MAKIQINVEMMLEIEPENYVDVEWPADSEEVATLTDPEEIRKYEEHRFQTGETDLCELFEICEVTEDDVTFKVIEE